MKVVSLFAFVVVLGTLAGGCAAEAGDGGRTSDKPGSPPSRKQAGDEGAVDIGELEKAEAEAKAEKKQAPGAAPPGAAAPVEATFEGRALALSTATAVRSSGSGMFFTAEGKGIVLGFSAPEDAPAGAHACADAAANVSLSIDGRFYDASSSLGSCTVTIETAASAVGGRIRGRLTASLVRTENAVPLFVETPAKLEATFDVVRAADRFDP